MHQRSEILGRCRARASPTWPGSRIEKRHEAVSMCDRWWKQNAPERVVVPRAAAISTSYGSASLHSPRPWRIL